MEIGLDVIAIDMLNAPYGRHDSNYAVICGLRGEEDEKAESTLSSTTRM